MTTGGVAPVRGTLLAGYRPQGRDEMLAPDGSLRAAWRALGDVLVDMDLRDVRRHRAEVARLLEDDGVTYHVPGTGERRRWQLDPLPLVLDAEDWATIESGVVQRAELLNLVLADLYGPQRLLAEGLLPPRLVLGHPGFLRQLHGQRLPGGQQLFTYAVDLARDASGAPLVLADRTQAPSGAAFALQNRVVTSRVLAPLHRTSQVQRLVPYFRALRKGLAAVAPVGATLPRTVLLTPGSRNETAFEHAFLASRLGLTLVEGSDLVVSDGRVWLRALGHLEPVDVILRRVDQEWCDPLELRADSLIGVPGLVQAIRNGTVTVVNALGSGVLENPALQAFLPRIAVELLGQPLRLPGPRTLWLGDAEARREVTADLSGWVLRPGAPVAGAEGVVVGAALSDARRRALVAAIAASPHGWVAQEALQPSSAPVLSPDGVVPRQSVLRAFAVADGTSYTVMPGGLTRVSAHDGAPVDGAGGTVSKDTWVLVGTMGPATSSWVDPLDEDVEIPASGMPSRAAENLFWLGRYSERAEGVARLLREIEDRRTEFSDRSGDAPERSAAGTACVHALLQALTHVTTTYPGFVGWEAERMLADPDEELDAVAGDEGRPGTLAHAIARLLDTVDAVRDQLSSDTWLVVTDLERRVRLTDQSGGMHPSRSQGARSAVGDLAKVLHGLLAIQGLGAENMVRDAGWYFMDAGRRFERSLQIVALLRATTTAVRDPAAEALLLESVLRIAESIITYRRRNRSQARIGSLLDLLLVDADNPRSLTYQLDLLTRDLQELPGHPGAGQVSPTERAVLEATTALRVADARSLARADGARRRHLDDFLVHVQGLLTTAAQDLEARHFTHLKRQRAIAMATDAPVRLPSGTR